jgi:hypothetical protein
LAPTFAPTLEGLLIKILLRFRHLKFEWIAL